MFSGELGGLSVDCQTRNMKVLDSNPLAPGYMSLNDGSVPT